MKKSFLITGFLIALLFIGVTEIFGQEMPITYPSESIVICTDRSLYTAGEKINFSALVVNNLVEEKDYYSRILYIELIKPDGSRLAGGKYLVDRFESSGYLQIPEEIITGYYYLKSYTKWMRNGDPQNYHFIRLKIVNPYNAEMNKGDERTEPAPGANAGMADQITLPPFMPEIRFSSGMQKYAPGEDVELQISNAGMSEPGLKLCLSVVPVATRDSIPFSPKRDSIPFNLQFYPETRGISISGRLAEVGTGNPVPNTLVNLSVVGAQVVMAIRTDETGHFNFALPGYTGSRDIFLCGEDLPGKQTEILIDNDFCSRPVVLPSPAFHLSETERSAVLKIAANQKISSAFYPEEVIGDTLRKKNELPFYGVPDEILRLEKYIDLPTVEDYFSELVGAVDVRKFEGRKIFRFNSYRTEMTIYDPLVMIDWVAVNDIDKVLAMSPRLIDRIELVNAPYLRGNIIYGGIISFVSKNNDFAGIDLPSSGTFINYRFLEDQPDAQTEPRAGNLPDARNTVYWDPDVRLTPGEDSVVRFISPATTGKYEIILTKISNRGTMIISITEFEVLR